MSGNAGVPGSAGPWSGGLGTARAFCVLAPNPGPMTLDGTNTWLIGEPGSATIGVIDPGPDDRRHWQAVAEEVERRDARIDLILLTHAHLDHSAGARLFASETGCAVRALDSAAALGGEGLMGGQVVELGGTELRVIPTPGHSSDSLSFWLPADDVLLTGDTILGRGTAVIAYPDGKLAPYLDSLHQLADFAVDKGLGTILPGHGPALTDPGAVIEFYLAHREERLEQVRDALAKIRSDPPTMAGRGATDEGLAQLIVERVYAGVSRSVWPGALMSVRAQLEHLKTSGT